MFAFEKKTLEKIFKSVEEIIEIPFFNLISAYEI
jgi:hypothetical protein